MLCVRLLVLVMVGAVGADEVQYIAAVLEHEPYSNWQAGGAAILRENARIFLEHAALAREQGADILVFPEYGLTSTNFEEGDVLFLAQVVPHPADLVAPCYLNHTNHHTQALSELSCGAAELELYLVVNLIEVVYCNLRRLDCPDVGYYLYNTQVVLDHCGVVVARYRKKHLFLEPELTPGTEDDSTAVFTTDFGVTFTMQICFDIMYKSPGVANVEGGVHDVAMSTAWVDELPFLTAPQIFRGWSAGLGVNLLVANYHNAAAGMLGSGLFPGVPGVESSYTYDHHGGTTLIVTPLTFVTSPSLSTSVTKPTNSFLHRRKQEGRAGQRLQPTDMVFIHEDLSRYNHLLLEQKGDASPMTASLCHNDSLCCTVTYTIAANMTTGRYMLLAYSGLVEKGGGVYSMFIQVCSVVFCLSDDVNSCARIEGESPPLVRSFMLHEISGVFGAFHVFPSLMRRDMTLTAEHLWNYDSISLSDNQHKAYIHVIGDPGSLLSATLMGRWYQRD